MPYRRAGLRKEYHEIPVAPLDSGNSDIVIPYDTLFGNFHVHISGRNSEDISRIAGSAHKIRRRVKTHIAEIDAVLAAPGLGNLRPAAIELGNIGRVRIDGESLLAVHSLVEDDEFHAFSIRKVNVFKGVRFRTKSMSTPFTSEARKAVENEPE